MVQTQGVGRCSADDAHLALTGLLRVGMRLLAVDLCVCWLTLTGVRMCLRVAASVNTDQNTRYPSLVLVGVL